MPARMKPRFGMSLWSLFVLSLLGIPRVIAHDLRWIEPQDIANLLLVFVPPVIWLAVVIWKHAESAFSALLIIGLFYGVGLAVAHQLMWGIAFDTPPTLGGNLANLPPALHTLIARVFAFISSLLTGAAIGVGLGIVGKVIQMATQRLGRR